MRTIALTVSYDGTDWHGFQRQKNVQTVQGALETALTATFLQPIELVCAGRTDSGVHAIGQVISFQTTNPMPIDRVDWVTNRHLPDTIRIRRAQEKPLAFHARFSAVYRRYWYVIQEGGKPDPIFGRFRWRIADRLDFDAMNAASTAICGRHDFKALCHQGEPEISTIRTLHHIRFHRWSHGWIVDVQADAFLHQMMRLLVSNLVKIGTHERPVHWLKELIGSKNRHLAGKGAPPCGLFLMRIGYSPTVNPRWGSLLEKLNNEMLLG